MGKGAYAYKTVEKGKVVCLARRRKYVIPKDGKGWCRTRLNRDGKICSLILNTASQPLPHEITCLMGYQHHYAAKYMSSHLAALCF